MTTVNEIIAQLSDVSPVSILIATNAVLTGAVAAQYRDCRRERDRLWAQIRELEKRFSAQ